MIELNKIYNIDMFEGHKSIDDKSIDMIYTDLPFNTTRNKWDVEIDLNQLWVDYKRIIKPNGAIVLHCQGMFTAKLMMLNNKMWKYNLIWKKGERVTQFLNAKRKILPNHEDIAIFYNKQCTYNPIKWDAGKISNIGGRNSIKLKKYGYTGNAVIGAYKPNTKMRYPKSILKFNTPKSNDGINGCMHPTQKPVALMEYLIKTYTNEGDLVLDNCMGSGTTGVACKNLNRDFIGIELDDKYFEVAQKRINDA